MKKRTRRREGNPAMACQTIENVRRKCSSCVYARPAFIDAALSMLLQSVLCRTHKYVIRSSCLRVPAVHRVLPIIFTKIRAHQTLHATYHKVIWLLEILSRASTFIFIQIFSVRYILVKLSTISPLWKILTISMQK